MPLLSPLTAYSDVCDSFHWRLPARLNIADVVCDRHARSRPEAVALTEIGADGSARPFTWRQTQRLANQMANTLVGLGVQPGDRVAILLSQSIETAIAHVGTWKTAAVSLPLFTLFGEQALSFRLRDSGASVLITETAHVPKIAAIRDTLPDLRTVIVTDAAAADDAVGLWPLLETSRDRFDNADTVPDDPAFIIYTSGTTGNPKGALHGHRAMLGHMPGVEFFHDFFPQPHDLMWTPADWAWIGGLMNCLMGAWFHGVPVLAHRADKFDPEAALRLMATHNVRNTFMPPTALKRMREIPDVASFGARLRTIACAGEPMGVELLEWGRGAFGLSFNEFYGQTECNLIVGNCQALMPVRAGAMGRPIPGHTIAVIDGDGQAVPAGAVGEIAARRPDPVMMLRYWNNETATAEKYLGDWLLTGDQGYMDDDGYLWFVGRDDDLITSAGYRIGPGEIEDCLTTHPAVRLAAVVGVPDPERTETIKAFILLRDGHEASADLEDSIRAFVKTRLSAHEYPREIAFVEDLPMTATGKIRRKELRDAEHARRVDGPTGARG